MGMMDLGDPDGDSACGTEDIRTSFRNSNLIFFIGFSEILAGGFF